MQPTRTEPYRTVPSRAEPYRTMQWKSAIRVQRASIRLLSCRSRGTVMSHEQYVPLKRTCMRNKESPDQQSGDVCFLVQANLFVKSPKLFIYQIQTHHLLSSSTLNVYTVMHRSKHRVFEAFSNRDPYRCVITTENTHIHR